ncbi:CehA/McbA family metallohydrolase [Sporosalibacterium faouarense]|uniref:CehA/McbA family metallohydrolase n=1 Tax=Sporosalibacterium faouarense TaxID=516123 RepID=UPI00192B8D76|nr:CehA/McbA family metallohydrolase [Sporosalibacterium faouarense]
MNRKISKGLNLLLVITMILTNLIGLSIPDRVNAASATDLFFSEYIEGSSNNKGIEIFNGTGSDVDLSQYTVELYSNGNTSAGSTTTLDGSLESGNVYIIVNSSANDEMKSISNATSGVANFNGDDTLILKNNGQIIDVFGQVGVDPGDGWGTNEEAKDHTLVRKSSVVSGDTDSSNPFDPTAEWDVYPKDTFTYLGSHTMDGFGDEEPVPEKVENVTASPMAGQVQKGTEIMLSTDTEDATVYYAVYADGNNDVSYEVFNDNSPIAVNEPLTIKTYASKDGLEDSDISEFEYSLIEEMTIIQARQEPSNTIVTVEGIITSASGNVYIQDETAGINLYNQSDDIEIAEGDLVKVTGTVTEYNGLLELKNYTVEKISSANPLPEPQEITIDQIGEEYEGELVKVSNVTIGAINTSGNTSLSDDLGNSVNVYRIPELTDITEGDKVDVVAIVSQFNDYQLYVRKADDVTKTDLGPDTEAPVITHIAVTEGNIGQDLEIKASVTDDRQVSNVKLYYKVTGTTEYETIDMNLSDGEYSAMISKDQLSTDGIAYYIEATDGTNTITSPEDTNTPYEVTITDDDISGPEITTVIPSDDEVLLDTETKPGIRAEFNDLSGIDTDTVKILLDGIDVTTGATVKEDSVSYYPEQDLELGAHEVTVEVSDTVGNDTSFTWTFNIGEEEYNFYYGQLHSHTNVSDGQGSLDDAYSWARDEGQADFFAVTDHSNWFDNESDRANENITNVSQSTSDEWKEMHTVADSYNSDGEFVALAGFEMTWSGSTGGWGHINTFNTPWFSSRTNSNMDLPAYYEHIAADTDSLSQLNHPGKTFGDFADFSFYSESADNVVHLIEVGNGEGPIRGSGYFPSYDYYTRALDKGWHLGPSNNQDNHKGQWITSNDARTVVLAPELTRSNIYDGIRNLRFYATEDKNLEIIYKVNGNIMGTTLDDPESLDISIEINDPDETDEIGKVSIISNGGVEVASKTFENNEAIWELELDPQYSYYYVRVDQGDKDIAVTAPVWTDEVTPVGISKVEVSQDPQIVNKPIEINATVYNNGPNMINDIKVEFYKDSIETDNKIGESTVGTITSGSTGLATMEWTSDEVGEYNIYAQTTINIDGVDKVFHSSTSVTYADPEDVTKIVLDTGHYNAYISGYYAGKYETLKDIFKENKFMLVENKDELTSEDLENAQLLIITDPQSTDDPDYDLTKSLYTDSEVAAIKEYTDNGGPLIVASRADYKDGTGEYSNGVQLNKILEAVGTNLRVNDDEVVDDTTNGGQPYRLYFDKYESTKYNLAENVPEGTTYSFYSGCSVITKDGGSDEAIDWLVKGHETTETLDSDYQGDNVPVTMGDVKVIGAEELSNGARIIVAGSIFFSDFETASSDDMYSNRQITENIINWMVQPKEVELKTIAKVREDKDNDGIPDHLGEKFSIIGRVTAQSEAVTPKNSFFEVIYVQDETGGITVFGVSATPLPLGTKVRITGVVDQYDGDAELSVENENNDVVILDDEITLVDPKTMTTGDSMLEENEGWLVKVQGTVTRMTENSLYLDDGSGEARVYVNGYIGDGTGNSETLGKWDPSIEVGDNVSAIGLASQDPEGHRIRVRNTTEIVKLEEVDYPVEIPSVNTSDINGNLTENFEEEDVVMVNTELTNIIDEAISGTVIIKLVDSEDRTYAIGFVNGVDLDAEEVRSLSLGFKVNGVSKGTHTAKVYLWSDLTDRTPLSEVGTFEFTVE